MSVSSVTNLDGERKPRRLPARELDPIEVRVLGCLMEKQLATPEYYPLTLNALIAACNQKSNREPVMEVGESEVQRALDRLQDEKLVWKVLGGRATRWDHNLDTTWHLDRPAKAVIALLFLRGPQTAGELRGRSDRLHSFEAIDDVEATLQRLGNGDAPIVRELPRRPGQKEARFSERLTRSSPKRGAAGKRKSEQPKRPARVRRAFAVQWRAGRGRGEQPFGSNGEVTLNAFVSEAESPFGFVTTIRGIPAG